MGGAIKLVRWIFTLGLLPLGLLAFLAETDIYHGVEPDLSAEWMIFGWFFYLSLAYVVVNLIELLGKRKG